MRIKVNYQLAELSYLNVSKENWEGKLHIIGSESNGSTIKMRFFIEFETDDVVTELRKYITDFYYNDIDITNNDLELLYSKINERQFYYTSINGIPYLKEYSNLNVVETTLKFLTDETFLEGYLNEISKAIIIEKDLEEAVHSIIIVEIDKIRKKEYQIREAVKNINQKSSLSFDTHHSFCSKKDELTF